ncbi:hypothetical protein BU17DRAFT_78926 [Hysterangium stoloniferum]|nr:hypothetical protein BU17DRAFT_78926 [Hysterangium stoloniferum]
MTFDLVHDKPSISLSPYTHYCPSPSPRQQQKKVLKRRTNKHNLRTRVGFGSSLLFTYTDNQASHNATTHAPNIVPHTLSIKAREAHIDVFRKEDILLCQIIVVFLSEKILKDEDWEREKVWQEE